MAGVIIFVDKGIKMFENDIEHTVGNPLFAIETSLAPLRKRITELRTEEALSIVDLIEESVNKAKIGLKNRKE